MSFTGYQPPGGLEIYVPQVRASSPSPAHTYPNPASWLFRLIEMVDANFRLSNRARSSDEKDPGLGTGLAYFVPQAGYNQYVLAHADQEEVCPLHSKRLGSGLTHP